MKRSASLSLGTLLLVALVANHAEAQTPTTSCDNLSMTRLASGTVLSAELVPAGQFTPPPGARGGGAQGAANPFADVPAFCRVTARLQPTSDSDIRIEVWLPAAGWNARLQVVGNGGFAGAIGYPALGTAIRDGYVAASTDTGHTGGNPEFMEGHPERLVDFAHRAIHELTLAAKRVSATYYSSAPRLSYFNGCSTSTRWWPRRTRRPNGPACRRSTPT